MTSDSLSIEVTIKGARGSDSYQVLVPKKNILNERHCRSVISAGLEMAFALLDAAYQKSEKTNERMDVG